MSEKKAKEARKAKGHMTVITAHVYRTPQGMNAIVQGIPADFNYAMACIGLINKTVASHFVHAATQQHPIQPSTGRGDN